MRSPAPKGVMPEEVLALAGFIRIINITGNCAWAMAEEGGLERLLGTSFGERTPEQNPNGLTCQVSQRQGGYHAEPGT